jgi:hypothetical protein
MPLHPEVNIGDILTDRGDGCFFVGKAKIMSSESIDDYPCLFKKLEWWQEREIKDLPDYVRWINGDVSKVLAWEYHHFFGLRLHTITSWYSVKGSQLIPSTKEEYEVHLSNQSIPHDTHS